MATFERPGVERFRFAVFGVVGFRVVVSGGEESEDRVRGFELRSRGLRRRALRPVSLMDQTTHLQSNGHSQDWSLLLTRRIVFVYW